MTGTFELFDHTADMGIRVRAETRAGLIEPAAAGLYAAIGELKADQSQGKSFQFCARGGDDAILLRDFLTELLVLFERDHCILIGTDEVEFGAGQMSIAGKSATVDVEQSIFYREVKAITYHDLELREVDGGFEAKLIVDI